MSITRIYTRRLQRFHAVTLHVVNSNIRNTQKHRIPN